MLYNSTQNAAEVVSAAQAIAQGISKDGGLFVPQEFPHYDEAAFKALLKEDYKGRAKKVFSDFLSDFTREEIDDCVEKAYTAEKFGGENPAPIAWTPATRENSDVVQQMRAQAPPDSASVLRRPSRHGAVPGAERRGQVPQGNNRGHEVCPDPF